MLSISGTNQLFAVEIVNKGFLQRCTKAGPVSYLLSWEILKIILFCFGVLHRSAGEGDVFDSLRLELSKMLHSSQWRSALFPLPRVWGAWRAMSVLSCFINKFLWYFQTCRDIVRRVQRIPIPHLVTCYPICSIPSLSVYTSFHSHYSFSELFEDKL